MTRIGLSRRNFLSSAAALAGSTLVRGTAGFALAGSEIPEDDAHADYTLTIATKPIELAPKRVVSITTYNGEFPGPQLRFKEGERV
jgi:FtsP/CotA-like multicopper oxidase with cupredoxin domain